LFSFAPGDGAVGRLAAGVERLLALDPRDRDELRAGVSAYARREWTWERTANRILAVA